MAAAPPPKRKTPERPYLPGVYNGAQGRNRTTDTAIFSLEQVFRKPHRVISVQIGSNLFLVALPPRMGRRRVRPIVGRHRLRTTPCPGYGIPPQARRRRASITAIGKAEFSRRCGDPVEEWLKSGFAIGGGKPRGCHANFQRIVGLERDACAPMRSEKIASVELHESADQLPETGVVRGLDRSAGTAKEFRQLVGLQSELGDDAKAPAAAALEGPEEIGIEARIGNADLAVGSHNLRFQQACGGHAKLFREGTKSSALNEAGNADGCAA